MDTIINDYVDNPKAQEITRANVKKLCREKGEEFAFTLLDFLLAEREELENVVDNVFTNGQSLAVIVREFGEAQYEEGYSEGESMGALGAYDEGFEDGVREGESRALDE